MALEPWGRTTMRKFIPLTIVLSLLATSGCQQKGGGRTIASRGQMMSVANIEETADLFGSLRSRFYIARSAYWFEVGRALQTLDTLEGAAYDARQGILTLHGKPAKNYGPYHLDDLMVALKAVYFEKESLGMTIDPDPANPQGPLMTVKYFAGCQNTAFGWVLFECDRLLKSFSYGQDNISGQEIKPEIPDFYNVLQLREAIGANDNEEWNRFWLTTDVSEGPSWYENPQQSNEFQPIVFVSDEGSAISFRRCRLYLRTEVMALQGGKLVKVEGRSSPAADRFAVHFSNRYADFGRIFPVFERAEALARLIVLAEWIEKSKIPLDVQFIRSYRQQLPLFTPVTTPAKTVSKETLERTREGPLRRIRRIYGGVDFKPRAFYAQDRDGSAARHRDLLERSLPEHPAGVSWTVGQPGEETRFVVLPTTEMKGLLIRSTTAKGTQFRRPRRKQESPESILPRPPEIAEPERVETVKREFFSLADLDKFRQQQTRAPPRLVLVDDRAEKIDAEKVALTNLQTLSLHNPIFQFSGLEANSERTDKIARESAPLIEVSTKKSWGLPLFPTALSSWTYNLPRLYSRQNPRLKRTIGIKGRADSQIEVADDLLLMSELGDIAVKFGEPRIDQERGALYYPAASPGANIIVGYYPGTNILELKNGIRIRFDTEGFPLEVIVPEKEIPTPTTFAFHYEGQKGDATGWPWPLTCAVKSAGNSAVSGQYDLMDKNMIKSLSGRSR